MAASSQEPTSLSTLAYPLSVLLAFTFNGCIISDIIAVLLLPAFGAP